MLLLEGIGEIAGSRLTAWVQGRLSLPSLRPGLGDSAAPSASLGRSSAFVSRDKGDKNDLVAGLLASACGTILFFAYSGGTAMRAVSQGSGQCRQGTRRVPRLLRGTRNVLVPLGISRRVPGWSRSFPPGWRTREFAGATGPCY